MSDLGTPTDTHDDRAYDGRRARRDRNSDAVVDAVVALFFDGEAFPTAQQVADRSGVSLRSVFRYFDDLDALATAAVALVIEQNPQLFIFQPPSTDTPVEARLDAWIDYRVRFNVELAPLIRATIARAARHEQVGNLLDAQRMEFTRKLGVLFEPELRDLSDDDRRQALAALHTASLFEGWDNLISRHGLSAAQASDVVRRSLRAALPTPD